MCIDIQLTLEHACYAGRVAFGGDACCGWWGVWQTLDTALLVSHIGRTLVFSLAHSEMVCAVLRCGVLWVSCVLCVASAVCCVCCLCRVAGGHESVIKRFIHLDVMKRFIKLCHCAVCT